MRKDDYRGSDPGKPRNMPAVLRHSFGYIVGAKKEKGQKKVKPAGRPEQRPLIFIIRIW